MIDFNSDGSRDLGQTVLLIPLAEKGTVTVTDADDTTVDLDITATAGKIAELPLPSLPLSLANQTIYTPLAVSSPQALTQLQALASNNPTLIKLVPGCD